jgi:hypothetical protein
VAEQATGIEGVVEGVADTATLLPGAHHAEAHNPGRPISWVGTSIVIIGFIIGGIAMVPAPHWVLFWVGSGVAIVGCLVLLFCRAMSEDWY